MSDAAGEQGGPRATGPHDRAGHDPAPLAPGQPDPTRMANQPALQSSSGLIWVVMGGLFAALSLVPLVLLTAAGGPSRPVALVAAVLVVALYALLLVLRFAIPRGPRRLGWLAACMLTMALAALLGVLLCALIEGGA